LGVSHEQIEKRRKDGQTSPVTPWEGQLQALVRYVRIVGSFIACVIVSSALLTCRIVLYLFRLGSEEKRKGPSADGNRNPSLELPKAQGIESLGMPLASPLYPICGPGSDFGRSLLHKAVCDMDVSDVQTQLSSGSGDYLEQRDQKGYCPIHSACALCLINPINSAMAGEIVRLLISAGADASIRDLDGNTSLHWAARAGDRGTAELLLLKNSPKGKSSKTSRFPSGRKYVSDALF